MNLKSFKISTTTWAIVWTVFAFIAGYNGESLGTIATLGGIALMFAWMYEQAKLGHDINEK